MSSNTAARSGVRTSYMSLVAGTFTFFQIGSGIYIFSGSPFWIGSESISSGMLMCSTMHANSTVPSLRDVCVHLALVKMRVYTFRIRIT
jgi:hypothetical protein